MHNVLWTSRCQFVFSVFLKGYFAKSIYKGSPLKKRVQDCGRTTDVSLTNPVLNLERNFQMSGPKRVSGSVFVGVILFTCWLLFFS